MVKGTDNKELYLNASHIIQEVSSNKNIYTLIVDDSFLKPLLDLLAEEDTH